MLMYRRTCSSHHWYTICRLDVCRCNTDDYMMLCCVQWGFYGYCHTVPSKSPPDTIKFSLKSFVFSLLTLANLSSYTSYPYTHDSNKFDFSIFSTSSSSSNFTEFFFNFYYFPTPTLTFYSHNSSLFWTLFYKPFELIIIKWNTIN